MNSGESWRSYARRFRPHAWSVGWAVVAAAAQTALAAPVVLLVKYLFDRALPARDVGGLAAAAGAIAGLSLGGAALSLWSRRKTLEATKSVVSEYRAELLERVQQAPRAWHDKSARAELHDQLVQDTERVDVMSNALLSELLPAAASGAALLALLAWVSPPLGALLVVCGLLNYGANRAVAARLKRSADQFREAFGAFSAGVLFLAEKLELIRIQTAEEPARKRRKEEIEQLRRASTRFAWLDTLYGLMQANLALLAALAVLVGGGVLAMRGRISIGELIAFYAGLGLLRSATHAALAAIPRVTMGLRALAGLEELMRKPAEPPYRGKATCGFDGRVELEGVDFGYGERLVLRNVSGWIEPGRVTALAGPNGCGKTTVARLVLGYYRPGAGRVRASGQPYEEIEMEELRRQMGVVPQEALLFSGTVRENLTFGMTSASERSIEEALEFAAARAWLRSLAGGLEARIGEDGLQLSGGQRQRLMLARAWLRRPKLLILDEPGNHLDPAALSEVLGNLATARSRPAVLLISHDEELIRRSDRIWRLPGLEVAHG